MSHIYYIKLSKYCDIDARLEHLGDMRIPSDFQLVYMIPRKSIKWLNIYTIKFQLQCIFKLFFMSH